MFDSATKLILGLVTGLVFGLLLQKGRVAKYEVLTGQFLFRDWTVAKVMGTAILVGALGVQLLVAGGLATLHVKAAQIGAVVLGGVLFGVGVAVLGLCPGTSVAALGEGRRDALAGLSGMLAGAIVFVLSTPLVKTIRGWSDLGKITLPEVTGTPPLAWAGGAAVLAAIGGVIWIVRSTRYHHIPVDNAA